MKKLTLIAMLTLSAFALQGCVAAVIGAGASTAKLASDPRTIGTQVDDATLDSRVGMKIKDNADYFKGSRIVVSAYNGNVLLVGQAKSVAHASKATNLAESVEGVNKVYNQIVIGELIGPGALAEDAWITTKVKAKLVGEKQTKSRDIKVITEDGQVFLMGIVKRDEGQLAAEIASKVDGVRLVSTIFTYID